MELRELKGRINEQGKLEVDLPNHLPPGDVVVNITIESLESDAEIEADEALWDAQFASTPTSVFDALIKKALADDAAGLTEECE